MYSKEHWEHVYSTKAANSVSWFQEHADLSLQLIEATGVAPTAAIIDVGGGASTLVDDLLAKGFANITVLDLAGAGLKTAQERLGARADQVVWREADITKAELPAQAYDVWHDRAVFHFLTEPEDRRAYLRVLLHAVKPGGHVVIATFAEDGPLQCSGLPVRRYSAEELLAELGEAFTLVAQRKEAHRTPAGAIQRFTYCYCRKAAP